MGLVKVWGRFGGSLTLKESEVPHLLKEPRRFVEKYFDSGGTLELVRLVPYRQWIPDITLEVILVKKKEDSR